MEHHICVTCGTQFTASERPPEDCPICQDERQYVPTGGQSWTTLADLSKSHNNRILPLEPGLFGIGTEPTFGIGQRALLVQGAEGNLLWDCISLLNDETRRWVEALGGISAIAISHPHYYSSMVEWGRAFDAPIYLHAKDAEWVMRPDPLIEFWEGKTLEWKNGITLHRLGVTSMEVRFCTGRRPSTRGAVLPLGPAGGYATGTGGEPGLEQEREVLDGGGERGPEGNGAEVKGNASTRRRLLGSPYAEWSYPSWLQPRRASHAQPHPGTAEDEGASKPFPAGGLGRGWLRRLSLRSPGPVAAVRIRRGGFRCGSGDPGGAVAREARASG